MNGHFFAENIVNHGPARYPVTELQQKQFPLATTPRRCADAILENL